MANNDLNTNPLFKEVAQKAAEVKQAYSNEPTFTSNMRESLVTSDPILNSARNNYTDKIAELFAHDKELAGSKLTAENMGMGITDNNYINPSIKFGYNKDLYAQKGKELAGAMNTYLSRQDLIGDIVDKAVKVYEAATAGKEADYQAAKDQLSTAVQLMTLDETKRHNLASETAGNTLTEREKSNAKTSLIADLKNGGTLADAIDSYKDRLTADEIRQVYDDNNVWGTRKESNAQVNRMFQAATKGSGAYDTFAALPTSVAKDANEKANTIVTSSQLLNTLSSKMGDKAPDFWQALASGDTGKLAKLTKPFRNDQELMAMIDSFEASVRQQIYGSAFTETESKLAKDWLASGSDQANQIWVKLMGQYKSANSTLYSTLKGKGYTDEEIQANLKQRGLINPTSSSSNGGWY